LSRKPAPKPRRNRTQILWKRWAEPRKLAVAFGTGLFIAVLLTIDLIPDKVNVRAGDIAREDVFAPRYVHYQDQLRTREMRRRARESVPKIYAAIQDAESGARRDTAEFFNAAERIAASGGGIPIQRRVQILQKEAHGISAEIAELALTLQPPHLRQARLEADRLAADVMSRPIPDDQPAALEEARNQARTRAVSPTLVPPARRVVAEVVAANIVPNQFYDARGTKEARDREDALVPVQYNTIHKGDRILRKGDRVTVEHIIELAELGLVRQEINWATTVSLVLLAFGLVSAFCLYLNQFHPQRLRRFSDLLLLSVVVCSSLLLFRIGSSAFGLQFAPDRLGFVGTVCSAMGAMVIAALLSPQIAVFVGVALGLLTSVMVGGELKFAILSIVSSLVAVQCVSNIRDRAAIGRACLIVATTNVATALIAHGATKADFSGEILQNALWGFAGGFVSVLLFYLFAAWLERPFRLTTHLTLLELSDASHPLLRRLALEAPGTHSHSVIVGNLAEAAAEAIGADSLFCRVASYYHDIGKVIRPHFFVENQSSENRHNSINPSLSCLVVTSHVKDGVELAEEYRLPPPIINIIREHHGTCLIKYFYHRAMTSGAEENTTALEYQFRYEGPRPQTKESGIIMIADSTEAASRTLEKPTPGRIRDLIERIVRDRLSDGQLDECDLTFKDLEKIISSMTRLLTSLLHARVEYPAGSTSDLRKLAADGAANKEPVGAAKALSDTPETAGTTLGEPAGL
jgi:putative nucleotidyltransferase with HDIG domain